MRSRETIEAQKTGNASEHAPKARKPVQLHPKMVPFVWKPGQSGNPGGRPKRDLAAELCQQVFENHPEEIYAGIRKLLKSGSAFGFQVAADRGFGKLTEKVQHSGEISLAERIERGRKKAAEAKKAE